LVISENTHSLIAYFSLALDVLDISGLSKTIQKKISGLFVLDQVAVFLIGQLGRCDSCVNHNISGDELVSQCFRILDLTNSTIGGRCILVECDNNDKLINFYKNNQFKIIKTNSSNDELVQMIRFI